MENMTATARAYGWFPMERARGSAARMRIRVAVAAVCLGCFSTLPAAGDVAAGSDLLNTPGEGETQTDFDANPIPSDFFGAGSDPLTGLVTLKGVPLVDLPMGVAHGADTIVERLQNAVLPSCPSQDTTDIEIVALHLQSIEPVTVTFNGGNGVCTGPGVPNPCCTGVGTGNCETEWQLDVTLSSTVAQATGSMDIRLECPEGGSFTTTNLPVRPRLVFTRTSGTLGTSPAVLDPSPQIDFSAVGYWVQTNGVEGIYRDADSSLAVSAGDTRLALPSVPVVGSAVAAGEVDIGTALIAFTAAEKHADPIVNGAYDAGEGIYNDVDLSGAVSVGDTRLSVRGFPAGSVVAGGDPDITAALVAFAAAERHEDPNSSASYDAGEGIYNDADSSAAVSLGDSRIMHSVPGFPVGSVVAAGNGDVGIGLLAFDQDPSLCTAAGVPFSCCTGVGTDDGTCSRERHTELIVSGAYNTVEGIYNDVDLSDTVSVGDIRLAVPGLPLASVVAAGNGDVGLVLVAFAAAEKYADLIVVNGSYDAGEDIYVDTDTNMTVSVGDTRLSGPGFPLGSVVAAANRDAGTGLVAFNFEDPSLCTASGNPFPCCTGAGTHDGTCSREMYADFNSNAAYDPEEGVYRDADADDTVSVGDTRVTTAGFLELEKVVAAGNGDVGVALIPFAVTERHADPDGNGMYDSGLGLLSSPGGTVDGDGDQLIDETFLATSSFTVGVRPFSCICARKAGGNSFRCHSTSEVALNDRHGLRSRPCPPPPPPPADPPLAVTLAAFSAEAGPGRVTLNWTTVSEIRNEGFNVLRSTASGQLGKVTNSSWIPAKGGPAFGAAYQFFDDTVAPHTTYYYLLEAVDTSGMRTLYGAHACTPDVDSDCQPFAVKIPPETNKSKGSPHD